MDINEFIDHLDVSPGHLYRLHTSKMIFETDSDDSGSVISENDNYRPPQYTYEELSQNLVEFNEDPPSDTEKYEGSDNENGPKENIPENIFKLSQLIADVYCANEEPYHEKGEDFNIIREKLEIQLTKFQLNGESESESSNSEVMKPNRIENSEQHELADADNSSFETTAQIANALLQLITPNRCGVCQSSEPSHYKRKSHYVGVRTWLTTQIAKLEDLTLPVETELLFCEICNLPLSGKTDAKKHYVKRSHIEKEQDFCTICLRVIEKVNMRAHIKSKNHLANAEAGTQSNTTDSDISESKSVTDSVSNEVNETKDQINEEQDTFNDETSRISYASVLKKHSVPTSEEQCKDVKDPACTKKDVVAKDYTKLADYILKYLNQKFCFVCNMPNTPTANHYTTQHHNVNMCKWMEDNRPIMALFQVDNPEDVVCLVCRTVFYTSDSAESHYKSESHQGKVLTFCKKCMVNDDPAKHISHQDLNDGQARIFKAANVESMNPVMVMTANLKMLCTPVFCEICQKDINMYNPYHYSERSHILMVRSWMGHGMEKLQVVIDPKLVFCEACSVVLCGTQSASAHYQSHVHLMNQQNYCAACAVRGTPMSMVQHFYSPAHKVNVDNVLKLQSGNTLTNSINQGHVPNTNKQALGQNLYFASAVAGPSTPTAPATPISVPRFESAVVSNPHKKTPLLNQNMSPIAGPSTSTLFADTRNQDIEITQSQMGQNAPCKPSIAETSKHIDIPLPRSRRFETSIANILNISEIPKKTDIQSDPDEEELYAQMNEEVKTLLETLYFSEKVPIRKAVNTLRRLNSDLMQDDAQTDANNLTSNRSTSRASRDFDIMESASENSDQYYRNISPIGSEMSRLHVERTNDKCSMF